MELERISTAVPWPRGLAVVNEVGARDVQHRVLALGRGAHRNQGGPRMANRDAGAGFIYEIDEAVSEPMVPGVTPSEPVRSNASIFAAPFTPPMQRWDLNAEPPEASKFCDRPYAGMAYDDDSGNVIVCAYSGVDLPTAPFFSKNATDAVFRYPLDEIRSSAGAPPPEAQVVARQDVTIIGWDAPAPGPSGFAHIGDHLYVACRTSSIVARFPVALRGKLPKKLEGDLVADFTGAADKMNIIDMCAAPGEILLVSTASLGGIWAFDPNPARVFRPTQQKPNLVALRELTGNHKTKCSNIALNSDGDLYVCTNNDDAKLAKTAGTIYRVNIAGDRTT